jgi:hypothetical protein
MLALMAVFMAANSAALNHFQREMQLIEQKQIKRHAENNPGR